MVKKIIKIDETVAKIVAEIENAPIPEGLDDDKRKSVEAQQRLARVHGELARYLMNETNRGTDVRALFQAILGLAGTTAINLLAGRDEETLKLMSPDGRIAFPGDPSHSAVHVAMDVFGIMLHTHLAVERNQLTPDEDYALQKVSGGVPFERKEVGDA